MDERRREFLDDLLTTASPSGFETAGQRVWLDYVREFADEVYTDDYGNAVAVSEGGGDGPSVALAGHGDEIGFMVREIDDDGFLRLTAIGGSDRTVTRGQHVTVHTDDGAVQAVVGQDAIHVRDADSESIDDIAEQHVDMGAADGEEARDLVEVGDPVTFSSTVEDLRGSRVAARGMDNRIGVWSAAEGLRRAAMRETDVTVYAVSTVQEELGLQGAKMVGFDLAPDAAVAIDVTHATDTPDVPPARSNGVELGAGPVVSRGGSNHPRLASAIRTVASESDRAVQIQAAGSRTGTDADYFFTARGGIPSLYVGVPNRYMHTPVETLDRGDLDATADLLADWAARAHEFEYAVDIETGESRSGR